MILDAAHHGLQLCAVEARALRVRRHAERLHLDHARVLAKANLGLEVEVKVNLGLEVEVVRAGAVQHLHGREPGGQLQRRAARVAVHDVRGMPALDPLRGAHVMAQLHKLVGVEGVVSS